MNHYCRESERGIDMPSCSKQCQHCRITQENIEADKKKGYEFGKLKQPPKVSQEQILKVIEENPIYSEAMAQYFKQIGYGIEKYPEPLNIATWDVIETLDHEISEIVDQLNYKIMFKLKMIELLKVLGVRK